MKFTKIFAFIAISTTLFISSCSSDDSSPIAPPITPGEEATQTEQAKKLPALGVFEFDHAGIKIPYLFEESNFSMLASTLNTEEIKYELIKVYKNKEEVYKAVLKNADDFAALFIRKITAESLDIHFDNTQYTTEKEAIASAYPSPTAGFEGHNKMGWLSLVKAKPAGIKLPVSGKYIFDASKMGGGEYSYTFDKDKVTFSTGSDSYAMQILDFKAATNKILLEGIGAKAGIFYVIQLKNITATGVSIARDTQEKKSDAEAIFNNAADLNKNFSQYDK